MLYHRFIPQLKYKAHIFESILSFARENPKLWKNGYDSNGQLWNIREMPLDYKSFPILEEIYESLKAEFKRPSFFLSHVPPGGLVNHVDHRKWGNLAFPLDGPFDNTPISFHDPFNQVIEQFHFKKTEDNSYIPAVFNTRMLHSVQVPLDNKGERIVLMMDLFEWPGHIFDKIDQGEFWKSGPTLKWQTP